MLKRSWLRRKVCRWQKLTVQLEGTCSWHLYDA